MARTSTRNQKRTTTGPVAQAGPPEIMTVEDTKRYYPDEFIVMEVTELTEFHAPSAGRIAFHGPSKDEAYDAWGRLLQLRSGKEYFIYFADTFPWFTDLREAVAYAEREGLP